MCQPFTPYKANEDIPVAEGDKVGLRNKNIHFFCEYLKNVLLLYQ